MNNVNIVRGYQNDIKIHDSVKVGSNVAINISGSHNSITIEQNVVLRNLNINISGDYNNLKVGAFCNLRGAIHLRQKMSSVEIGQNTTFVGVNLFAMEGKKIFIGEDCMFSSGIYIRNSDEHPITDIFSKARINEASDIFIGNHVWIGEGVTLQKGSSIPNNSVVGAKSVVTKKLIIENSIYIGTPAQLLRSNIRWDRDFIDC